MRREALDCDVCAVRHDAKTYTVKIVQGVAGQEEEVASTTLDLCAKALERLKDFIDRGTHPPTKRKATEAKAE